MFFRKFIYFDYIFRRFQQNEGRPTKKQAERPKIIIFNQKSAFSAKKIDTDRRF